MVLSPEACGWVRAAEHACHVICALPLQGEAAASVKCGLVATGHKVK